MNYWPAFALGFLGSIHCALMCSPLMLTIQWGGKTGLTALRNKLIYQVGRICTYIGIGLVFYSVGSQLNLAAFQKTVSIAIGCLLILLAATPIFESSVLNQGALVFYGRLNQLMSPVTRRTGVWSKFTLGALNGLLPCGLVYVAALTSVLQSSPSAVAKSMLFFGIGTSPLILAVLYGFGFIKRGTNVPTKHIRPIVFALIGTFFILRGMELGIPYVSPIMNLTLEEDPVLCE